MISPQQWGARIDYDTWPDDDAPNDKIINHWRATPHADHSGGIEGEKRALRSIEAFHIDNRGWRGIGYGFAIGQSDSIYRLRGFTPSYAANPGDIDDDGFSENREAWPILWLVGKGEVPSPGMYDAHDELWESLEVHATIRLPQYGHGEVFNLSGTGTRTSCPGPDILAYTQHRYRQEEITVAWQQPGDPIATIEDADAVFEYQGPFAPGFNQASYEGNWSDADKEVNARVWMVMARITDKMMQEG